ncbi:MAG: SDR family oxidoreductase [Chitinophagales bacterium]|nr:SDR family oxidoreductase [Chitinophagales bacterium]
MQLNNKVIWITGASSGIGEALAKKIASEGAHLILSARRKDELERVRSSLAVKEDNCLVLQLDLEDIEQFPAKVNEVIRHFGHIDILINNAGVSQRSLAADTPIDVDKRLIAINYIGTVALTKCVLPHMLQRQSGLIVTVTSAVGKIPSPWRSSYAAAKHALHGFFDSLRAECYDRGLRVLLVCPGFVATNISVNALTETGKPLGEMDDATRKGLSPDECAAQIIRAIKKGKEEVIVSGPKEKFAIWLKRFFPGVFSVLIRKMKVR